MKFYTRQHKHYCGIDLHARQMYVCILDAAGKVCLSRNLECSPQVLLAAVQPFREDLVVAVECMFAWYWVADVCAQEGIAFVLGHALYMGAIHGGKAKNDKIDAHKIAGLVRGGMLAQAYVYPPRMRATRDLLRRRCHLVNKRAELITHIQNTVSQYNLPPLEGRIQKRHEREGLLAHFPDVQVRNSIALDLAMIDQYDALLPKLERHIRACAKEHDRKAFALLRSIHGADLIIPLVILYEICTIERFPAGAGLPVLLPAGQARPGIERQAAGACRGQDRQRPPEVDLRGAGHHVPARQPPGSAAARAAQETARQGQGACHPGRQARPRGVLHAQARTDLRPAQVLPGLIRSRRRQLDA